MPSATTRRNFEDQIPSFMSVFDLDAETIADRDTVTVVHPKIDMEGKAPALLHPSHQPGLRPGAIASDPSHRHHDSTSTQASESADSSPTTTLSTTDSSPLSDPSPSSSPDSPVNLIPLNNFPGTSFSLHPNNNTNLHVTPQPPYLERPMTSPSPRRPRNMKGLSIQPPMSINTSSQQSLVSEPSSPSFIKPKIPAMKRKPSQLSLKTNTTDLITKSTVEVPPSPAMPPILQRRALKHSTSSPHMFAGIKSSTWGPSGGMTFPKVLERNELGLSEVLRPMKSSMNTTFESTIEEEESPIKPQLASRSEYQPCSPEANNEDLKTPGYPDGPIAIYDDNIFLYLEPTAEEAARFDLVINVAREVRNPFEVMDEQARLRQSMPSDMSPIPDTAVSTASFATAFEYQPGEDRMVETPTTPKANPILRPEYIHMPWDHNTDIAPDLMKLCETIESRIKEDKKVLIHCQQGASRSASLIIAYGIYRNRSLSVNDAYYAAQAKSRWISPNMKLMYSLQDFHKEVTKKHLPVSSRPRAGRSPTKHRLTMSADAIDIAPKEPRTAPLPGDEMDTEESESSQGPSRLRGNSSPTAPAVSPGPASAPPSFAWNSAAEESEATVPEIITPTKAAADLPERPRSSKGRSDPIAVPAPAPPAQSFWSRPPPSPGFAPIGNLGFQSLSFGNFRSKTPEPRRTEPPVERTVTLSSSLPKESALMSPRAETMTNNPLQRIPEVAGMRFVESPPTPAEGLFSPRATMFPRDPFSPFGRPPQVDDPRSPPTKGETPIVRSIDDIL